MIKINLLFHQPHPLMSNARSARAGSYSHVRSRLSVQSTRALLCVGVWSVMGYVKDGGMKAAAVLPEVKGKEDELSADWDSLYTDFN